MRFERGVERFFGLSLQRQIDGRPRRQHVLALALGDALDFFIGPIEEPVGARRACVFSTILAGFMRAAVHLARRVVAGVDEVIENLIGAGARRREIDERRVFRRRLEEPGEHRRFRHVDVADRLAEIILRSRFDAERAAAHVGAVEVELQDFPLRVAALEQEGEEQLLDLSLQRAFRG